LGDLQIIYEDHDILVINKPCGIAVQSIEDDIVKSYNQSHNINLHPITRLDQAVSGLTLFAKHSKEAALLSGMIDDQKISKYYTAIVEGHMAAEQGQLNHKLMKKGQKAVVSPNGKEAALTFKKMTTLDRFTKLEITLLTGRFHQIRAQLSTEGHPIKGDLKYGSKRSNKEGGIYLHCHKMILPHNGTILQLEAEPPKDKNLYFIK
jgi:23S rRNA pseudouridine1911/1915/1917 synthase